MELVRHVLLGMDTMYKFVNDMVSNIHDDVGMDDLAMTRVILPEDLPAPKRVKLCQQLIARPAMSAGELLAKIVCDRDDVACMRDVEDMPMARLSISTPSYIS